MKKNAITGIAILALLSLGLNACGATPAAPTPTPVDVNAINTAAMQTAIVELTRRAPTVTPTPSITPTITPTPTMTSTLTITPTNTPLQPSTENNISIYFSYLVDEENCVFWMVPHPVNHGFTGDMLKDVELAVRYLLNNKYDSPSNPLGASDLYFTSVEVVDTELKVVLGGNIVRHDNLCLNRQASKQLFTTISAAADRYEYPVIKTISVWVNEILFDDIMLEG
jgi:hypothetical protein